MTEDEIEGNPVDEGTRRRGTATPVHRPQRPAGSTHSSTRGLRPPEQLERPAGWSPLSGLKGVKPPLVFGGRTWDCSPGNVHSPGRREKVWEAWEQPSLLATI